MTAASFALLQSFLYLFSARIGCRGFPKYAHFRFALSRKSHQTRGGVTARAVIFPFTATAFCADWLSGLPKIRSFPFCSEPQAHQTRGGVTARAVFFPLPPQRFARIGCRGSRKYAHFRFALSRKRTRRAAELQRVLCFFLYRHSVLREFAVGLPEKKLISVLL